MSMIQIPVELRRAGVTHISVPRIRRARGEGPSANRLRRSSALRGKQNRWSLRWFRLNGPTGCRRKRRCHEGDLRGSSKSFRKVGVIRHRALQTEPTKPVVDQIQDARLRLPPLRAACAGAANHRRAATNETSAYRTGHPVLANPSPEAGREHSEFSCSRNPREYLAMKRRQPEVRTYISAAAPNTALRFASFKRSTWSGERSKQMSADTGMSYQSCSARHNDGLRECGYWHGKPWKPVETLAMVLGFIVYWPIGLRSWAGNSGRRNPVTPATLFPSGEKNGKNGDVGVRSRPLGLCGKKLVHLRIWHGLDRKSRLRRMACH